MGQLDRYILRQVLRPMGATIFIALLALLAERSLSVIDLVIGWRGSLLVVFEMLGYLIPHYMGLALPAAFFLGILFAFSRLSKESELDAMTAGGYGLPRMLKPLMWAALITALLHLVLVSYLQPYSRYAYRAAVHAVTNVSFQSLIQPGRFVTVAGNTYFVEGMSEDRESFEQLFLFSADPDRGNVAVTAKTGRLVSTGPLDPLQLELGEGVQQFIPAGTTEEGRSPNAVTIRFGTFLTDLSGRTPQAFRPRGDDERELTLTELYQLQGRDRGTIEAHEIDAELSGRLVRTISILVLPLLALPFSLGRRRAQTSSGFMLGIALLIGYNQLIKTGESLVDDGVVGALPALWLPLLLFIAGSALLFWRRAAFVPRPFELRRLEWLIERLTRMIGRHRQPA